MSLTRTKIPTPVRGVPDVLARMPCGPRMWSAVALVACALAALCSTAHAGKARSYYFLMYDVKLAEDMPESLIEQIRAQARRAIAAHPRLLAELPADCPDPRTEPKKFTKYLRKHKIAPYRVDVEVLSHAVSIEDMRPPRKGKRIAASISLRLFGERMPRRMFGFAGEGSSTIKLEVGKKVRERDRKFANHDAIERAVDDALAMALMRLDERTGPKKKRRAKKKRRSKKKRHTKK